MSSPNIPYTLVRSRRKTVAIHITKSATVEVRAPLRTPRAEIERFIATKAQWILSTQAKRALYNERKAAFALRYGDTVAFGGQAYPILAREGGGAGFDGHCVYLPSGLAPEDIKRLVVQIYKLVAKRTLPAKVAEFAQRMGVKPTAVRVTSAKTRWGSCSGKGSVSFSWRLLLADADVVDYVVVHELAHLKELNHAPQFWAVVGEVLPDYAQRKQRLRELQDRLSQEDWD